jgi:hypothetical protein
VNFFLDTKNFLDKNGLSHLWDKIGDNFLDYTSLQTVINAIDEEKADIDSPEFIGTPTAPTTDLEDSSQKLATTEFVHNVVSSSTGGLVLDSIKIKNPPDKVDYKAGEVFSDAGMVITANYSNGYVVVIEDIVITGYNFDTSPLVAGTSSITINYTEGGISCSVVQLISVSKTSLSIPSQDGTLIYNGSTQTPLWNNYDSSKMTISGTTSSINAGIFNVIFTLKDTNLYEWSNGKTDPYQTSWTIA